MAFPITKVSNMEKEKKFKIYHSASSTLNPISPGRAADAVMDYQQRFPSRKAFFKPEIQMVPDYWSFKVSLKHMTLRV